MVEALDLRNAVRVNCKADIQFENFCIETFYKAKMYNYSLGGMYFEADYAPLPGTDIYIGINNCPYHSGPDLYRARVKWRRQLPPGVSAYQYGVGVEYYDPINL
jgi:hypothetical protein